MLLPEVSTHELPLLVVDPAEAGPPIWLPQPARAVAMTAAVSGIRVRLDTVTFTIYLLLTRRCSRQRLASRSSSRTVVAQRRSELFSAGGSSFPAHIGAVPVSRP
jgi:hypothetical protein